MEFETCARSFVVYLSTRRMARVHPVPQHMEPTLAEKVSVLQRELNLSEGANLVDAVDNALEKIGLADELRGQPLTRKVDAALQTLGVTPQSVPMGTPVSNAPVTAPVPMVIEARVVQEVVEAAPPPPETVSVQMSADDYVDEVYYNGQSIRPKR